MTDQNLGDLTYSRTYPAPRDLVFECMTNPEHLTHFWGPIGVHTPIENITVDLRVGGAFETTMVNDATGDEYPMRAVFLTVERPNRLVFAEPYGEVPMTTDLTFIDLGDGRTQVDALQTNVPEMFRSPEAQAGMQSSFDKFEAYLTGL